MDLVNHLELTVHPSQVRPVLRALLRAIFFHRTLDAIEPETLELLESHISCGTSSSIQREINGKIEDFSREFLDTRLDKGELAVVFLQKKPKKGWFAITEELVPWEEHLITITFSKSSKPGPNPLPAALLQILTFCVENKGNVPPLSGNSEQSNVSHQIMIAPPSPSELFAPSPPPSHPMRLTSPPPAPSTTSTPATATARDLAMPPTSAMGITGHEAGSMGSARRALSPASATLGYLEQAKDGLRAVGAKAGAGVGWGGRAMGAAFGRGSGDRGGYRE
ncbi:hypothetical protein IAT38_004264 [Cryptococcus sp. DSM 104549]